MMKTLSSLIAGAAAIAALGAAPLALAQAKAPAAAAKAPAAAAPKAAAPAAAAPATPPPPSFTANIPGVCVLSREGIVGGSKVGKYVQTRLGQLGTQANAEIAGEKTAIETAAKDLDAKKATLAQAAYQQQGAALQQRAEALNEKAQQRERELQATDQKAVQRVLSEAASIVDAQVKAKNCAILIDNNAVLGGNQAMDLTPGVVAGLDAKLTQFDFDREHLDAQPGAQQR